MKSHTSPVESATAPDAPAKANTLIKDLMLRWLDIKCYEEHVTEGAEKFSVLSRHAFFFVAVSSYVRYCTSTSE